MKQGICAGANNQENNSLSGCLQSYLMSVGADFVNYYFWCSSCLTNLLKIISRSCLYRGDRMSE